MSPFSSQLLDLVATYGPAMVFLLAVLETSFVTGLVVPAGLATSLATVLAVRGALDPLAVAAAAVVGGWTGDVVGFQVGRTWGAALEGSASRAAAAYRRHRDRAAPFLRRHPAWSVTLARLVAFVRTVAPMAAGSSGMGWPRFLLFEAPGLAAWAVLYVGVGLLAGESWERVGSVVGVGWLVVFVVAGAVLRLRGRSAPDAVPGAPADEGA